MQNEAGALIGFIGLFGIVTLVAIIISYQSLKFKLKDEIRDGIRELREEIWKLRK